MSTKTMFARFVIAAVILGPCLAVRADVAAAPKRIPYCSVALAKTPGSNRTIWGLASSDEACAAAKTWLGQTKVDWQVQGEFTEDQRLDVQLRCVRNGLLYVEIFSGRGAEALQKAAFAPIARDHACLVAQVGDVIYYPNQKILNTPRDLLTFTKEQQLDLTALGRVLQDPKNAGKTFDLPRLDVSNDGQELTLHIPDAPRFAPEKGSAVLQTQVDQSFAKVPVHETSVPTNDQARAGNGGFELLATPEDGNGGGSGGSADQGGNIIARTNDHRRFGDRSKLAVDFAWDMNVQKDGSGQADATVVGTIAQYDKTLGTAGLFSKRLRVDPNSTVNDAAEISSKFQVLGKTIDLLEPKTVQLREHIEIDAQVYQRQSITVATVPFMVGPVPAELVFRVYGELGRKRDYVEVGIAPDDVQAVTMHAGIRPYASLGAEVAAGVVTNELPDWLGTPKLEAYAQGVLLESTILAQVDADTRSKGPCAEVTLLEPRILGINVGVRAHVTLTNATMEYQKRLIQESCKEVDSLGLADFSGAALTDFNIGGSSGVSIGGGGVSIGGNDVNPGAILGNGQKALEDTLSMDPGKVIGGAAGRLEDVINSAPGQLTDFLRKGCNQANAIINKAGQFTGLNYDKIYYSLDGIPLDQKHSWYQLNACKDHPDPSTLEVCNRHPAQSIDVAVARQVNGAWILQGWTSVPPATCKNVANLGTYQGKAYVYGRIAATGTYWGQGGMKLCANLQSEFSHTNADTMDCSSAGLAQITTSGMDIKPGTNRFSMEVNLQTVKFCNQTDYEVVYGAVGYSLGGKPFASGWFPVKKGMCRDVLRLADGDIYGYATANTKGIGQEWTGSGMSSAFCTQGGAFKDLATDDGCVSGGFKRSFGKIQGTTWRIGKP